MASSFHSRAAVTRGRGIRYPRGFAGLQMTLFHRRLEQALTYRAMKRAMPNDPDLPPGYADGEYADLTQPVSEQAEVGDVVPSPGVAPVADEMVEF